MPKKGQKGLTFKVGFVDGIEGFIKRHPELGWASTPEAVRHAWNKFVAEYEEEKGEKPE